MMPRLIVFLIACVVLTQPGRALAARGETLVAFAGRSIPGGGVAPPSNTAGILSRRALPAAGAPTARPVRSGVEGRLARLDATPDVQHGLPAQSSPEPLDRTVTLYELVLRDGSRLYGAIERQDEAEVVLRTAAGASVTAKRSEIASLKEVTGHVTGGEFLPPDPNATRMFFGPTGRSLARGQTYLGVYEFVMPFVQVGVTDRLSIGGGTPLMFGLNDSNRPFWITPKLQVLNTPRTQVAVGALHVFQTDGDGGGVGYVVGTRGDTRASITVGGGLAYGTEGDRSGLLMIGGERQVRRNLKLISENYVWKHGNGVASAGVRFFGDRLSADLAIGIPIGADEVFAFPVVNFVYVF